jgi:glycosyltransferase involved in cell wall biosynthesis
VRIVIDLQGAQTVSRNRGIGRYTLSLTKAIIRNHSDHEVIIVLNGLFQNTIDKILSEFQNQLPHRNIRVWHAPSHRNLNNRKNTSHKITAEKIREAFLISLKPDFVLITSIFEGLVDDAVTSIGTYTKDLPTASILYDLIPMIYTSPYLDNSEVKNWYYTKIDHLQKADILLAISESTRQEGIELLGLSPEYTVNISAASDPYFCRRKISPKMDIQLRQEHNLRRPFVMYTGGIDYRKNIEGLIRAYAKLPTNIRKNHQLAIICSIAQNDRVRLNQLVTSQGLQASDVIFTGYVSDENLVLLYNLCEVFVFPSFHEGFGLPALEAMSCGKAVIGSNTSSIPEVIGNNEALFDPHDDLSIANKLFQVLNDESFRQKLEQHSVVQSKKFSWDRSAETVIKTFENWYTKKSLRKVNTKAGERLKLAYISPLPPEQSGISEYSAELLPELHKYYQIDVIVKQRTVADRWINENCKIKSTKWFKKNHKQYDRVLYHFGNSPFHHHMFELLEVVSGIVVLHDFSLSDIVSYMDLIDSTPNLLNKHLYLSHGYASIKERYTKNAVEITNTYPMNLSILQDALGLIVHSQSAIRMAQKWYGENLQKSIEVIPHLRIPSNNQNQGTAKKDLHLPQNSFLICSFGMLNQTKLNHRLLNAFISSKLSRVPNCYLVFVGEIFNDNYGARLAKTIKQSGLNDRVRITGWVSKTDFHKYLSAADIGVQLRFQSRGETSATSLDCMNYGLATIVNANGSMADLPNDCVLKLDNKFENIELSSALEELYNSKEKRKKLGKRSKEFIRAKHNPAICAEKYFRSIEAVYRRTTNSIDTLIHSIASSEKTLKNPDLFRVADCLAKSFPIIPRHKQLLIDISELFRNEVPSRVLDAARSILKELVVNPPPGFRVEPVYATVDQEYIHARQYTLKLLDCPSHILADEPIDHYDDDIFLCFNTLEKWFDTQVDDFTHFESKEVVEELDDWITDNISKHIDTMNYLKINSGNIFKRIAW